MMTPEHEHWYSNARSSVCIADSNADWHGEFDLIVVGFGGAGASAAIEALEQGARVLIVDRLHGGGATEISGGIYYAGSGTRFQQAAGFTDSVDNMFNYLKMETRGIVSDDTLRCFCEQSLDNLQWLEDNQVPFDSTYCPVKTSYPTNKYFLYYSGNEAVHEYTQQADPVPRGHRSYSKGLSGEAFFGALKQSAINKGAVIKLNSEATRLLTNARGDVIGIETSEFAPDSPALKQHHKLVERYKKLRLLGPLLEGLLKKIDHTEQQKDQQQRYRATKGVVLASGGFIFNKQMLQHYAAPYKDGMPLGTPGCDGSGIRLGQSVGGAIDNMHHVSAWRFINPPLSWAKGIIVNQKGERYVNEQVYGAKLGYHMVAENNGTAILIINKKLFWKAVKETLFGGIWFFQVAPALMNLFLNAKKAKTIAALAEKIQANPEQLAESLSAYNQAARNNSADVFNKSPEFMADLSEGPWYAMDISIDSKLYPCPMITLGGLKVNEQTGAVKHEEGHDIKGLYAAGRTAIGIASRFYVSGLSLADCVFSGRRAARSACK